MAEPRNLLENWCPVGMSIPDAFRALGAERVRELEAGLDAWPESEVDERHAALCLAAHLGRWPVLRDQVRVGDGLADLELHRDGEPVEVAEVMSTLDQVFMGNFDFLKRRLIAAVSAAYRGPGAWDLDFERGVELPRGRNLQSAAMTWASRISALDAEERMHANPIGDGVSAYRLASDHPRGVFFGGASAEVPSSGDAPYLDRLTQYLASDGIVHRHVEKLIRDGDSIGAARRHLFLRPASTGRNGGLLGMSPSYFTWGTFSAPDGLTDVWLDAGDFNVFHWTGELGWVFHPGSDDRAESARRYAPPNLEATFATDNLEGKET